MDLCHRKKTTDSISDLNCMLTIRVFSSHLHGARHTAHTTNHFHFRACWSTSRKKNLFCETTTFSTDVRHRHGTKDYEKAANRCRKIQISPFPSFQGRLALQRDVRPWRHSSKSLMPVLAFRTPLCEVSMSQTAITFDFNTFDHHVMHRYLVNE